MALVVCTQLKLVKTTISSATNFDYLVNTPLTQVYCTGRLYFVLLLVLKVSITLHLILASVYAHSVHCDWWHTGTGSRSVMPYKGIRPVRQFLQWLKRVDEASMLDRAVIGGYFSYPPIPVTLQNFVENRHGK